MLVSPYNSEFTSEPIDSEVYFRYVIQCIDSKKDVLEGIKKAVNDVIRKNCNGANFLMADGVKLYAFRYGYGLFLLLRNPGSPFYEKSKETSLLIKTKALANEKAVLVASEELTDEDWEKLRDGELAVVDENLNITRLNIL